MAAGTVACQALWMTRAATRSIRDRGAAMPAPARRDALAPTALLVAASWSSAGRASGGLTLRAVADASRRVSAAEHRATISEVDHAWTGCWRRTFGASLDRRASARLHSDAVSTPFLPERTTRTSSTSASWLALNVELERARPRTWPPTWRECTRRAAPHPRLAQLRGSVDETGLDLIVAVVDGLLAPSRAGAPDSRLTVAPQPGRTSRVTLA